jgi:hypothetical protein
LYSLWNADLVRRSALLCGGCYFLDSGAAIPCFDRWYCARFTTIPGVQDDVAEIVLNLKQVRFKLIDKKPIKSSSI